MEADEMDLARQRVWLDAVDLRGARFGMLATDTLASADTPAPVAPWLDQGDGFATSLGTGTSAWPTWTCPESGLALHQGSVTLPAGFQDAAPGVRGTSTSARRTWPSATRTHRSQGCRKPTLTAATRTACPP